MTELTSKIQLALGEKATKLLPTNIRKDLEIFNVTGTLEPAAIPKEDYEECLLLTEDILGTKEYTELEYIESTGTQYIDTNISASSTLGVETEFAYTQIEQEAVLFGARSGDTNRFGMLIWAYKYHMMVGQADTVNIDADLLKHRFYIQVNSDLEYSWELDDVAGDGTTSESIKVPLTLRIFSSGRSTDPKGKIKLYNFKIYNSSGELLRNFIPVKDPDNTVCLYDKISKTYFYNAGTGNFTPGPEKEV